jgi:hypothetical protein
VTELGGGLVAVEVGGVEATARLTGRTDIMRALLDEAARLVGGL